MGCGNSRHAPAEDKKVRKENEKVNLDTLSRAERFEMGLPLIYTSVEEYCKLIRSISPQYKTITVKELLDGMASNISAWKKVQPDSVFVQILNESPFLREEPGAKDLSKNSLMLWGIILCGGSSELKTITFYDILQDNQQERISATDKDFPGNFNLMIDLGTKLVNEWEAKSTSQEPERSQEFIEKLDSTRETLAEDEFLEHVFGNHSNITRTEWE